MPPPFRRTPLDQSAIDEILGRNGGESGYQGEGPQINPRYQPDEIQYYELEQAINRGRSRQHERQRIFHVLKPLQVRAVPAMVTTTGANVPARLLIANPKRMQLFLCAFSGAANTNFWGPSQGAAKTLIIPINSTVQIITTVMIDEIWVVSTAGATTFGALEGIIVPEANIPL